MSDANSLSSPLKLSSPSTINNNNPNKSSNLETATIAAGTSSSAGVGESFDSLLEADLLSTEVLDRSSPDLWPENCKCRED